MNELKYLTSTSKWELKETQCALLSSIEKLSLIWLEICKIGVLRGCIDYLKDAGENTNNFLILEKEKLNSLELSSGITKEFHLLDHL